MIPILTFAGVNKSISLSNMYTLLFVLKFRSVAGAPPKMKRNTRLVRGS